MVKLDLTKLFEIATNYLMLDKSDKLRLEEAQILIPTKKNPAQYRIVVSFLVEDNGLLSYLNTSDKPDLVRLYKTMKILDNEVISYEIYED